MNTPLPRITVAKASFGGLAARLMLAWLIIAAIGFILANAVDAHGRTPLGILRALESLPVWKLDRGPEHAQLKAEQHQRVTSAIASVARDADEAAMLLTIGWHESAWSLAVERGVFTKGQGDPDRNGVPTSISNYQIKRRAASSREAWEAAKTDVRVATQEAAFALRRARNMCRSKPGDPIRQAFSAYGTGSCMGRLKDLEKRLATFRSVRSKL
jgi:hypothetical protein